MTVASLSRKSRAAGHSREELALSLPKDGNPDPMWTDLPPSLHGGAKIGDFHFLGWAAGPWPLRMTSHNFLQRRVNGRHSTRFLTDKISPPGECKGYSTHLRSGSGCLMRTQGSSIHSEDYHKHCQRYQEIRLRH